MDYTKGAWKASGNLVEVLGRGVIAICPSPKDNGTLEFITNVRLVAASPDMYEALKETTEGLCEACKRTVEICESEGLRAYPCTQDCEIILKAKKALAKTEGRKEVK